MDWIALHWKWFAGAGVAVAGALWWGWRKWKERK